ncbi:MAG TPA: glycosyltransferase [Bacteroidales bacterium]|nr:glycosyltransferase [Bacteroidales bacterium]
MIYTRKTETEQRAFFEACLEKFNEAAKNLPEYRYYYRIADSVVCLHFADKALVSFMTNAIAHLECAAVTDPDLTIHLWDSETSGVEMVQPPCEWGCFTDRGDIWGFDSKVIRTAFHWGEFSVNVMDLESRQGVYWVQTVKTMPYWTASAPLRTMFHWWMEHLGHQMLHAAVVGHDGKALVITGKGGIGKSTTALNSLEAGMDYLSDDYVIISLNPEPTAWCLYSTAKVNAGELDLYPGLAPLASPLIKPDQEKAVIFLYPDRKDQLALSMPLAGLLTPVFGEGEATTTRAIPNWRIMRNMSFTTMAQLPGAGEHTNTFIHKLSHSLPVMELVLGQDRKAVPEVLTSLLRDETSLRQMDFPSVDDRSRHWPMISIVVPVYNGGSFIEEAIQNILAQEYPSIEIIIVDDGSTDDTAEVVKRLPIDVRYFYQENSGPAAARNRGIRDASADFIALLDVDDLWPDKNLFLMSRHLMDDPDVLVVHGQAQVLDKDLITDEYKYVGSPMEAFQGYIGAGLYRKEAFNVVGLYDTFMRMGEDADWFQRATELRINLKKLDEVTLFVRRHGHNMTEGLDLVALNTLTVFKKSLDRMRHPVRDEEIAHLAADTSVIVPVYNGEAYLTQALDSILSQGIRFREVLVVDDGSTDRSAEIARTFSAKVRLITQENKGAAAARNRGITMAQGTYLAFLDADDLWVMGGIKLLLKTFTNQPDLDIVFGHVEQFISPELDESARRPLRNELREMPGYLMGAMVAKKLVFDKVGLLPENLQLGEFIDWFHQAQHQGVKYKMLEPVVMRRRIHTTNQGILKKAHMQDYATVAHAALKRLREEQGKKKE